MASKEDKPVTPQVDPELTVKPTATGAAAAMVARDNAIIDAKLKEKQEFRAEAESKEPKLDYEIRAAAAARKETEALNVVEENAKPADKDFEATLDYEIRAELAARKENIMEKHAEAQAIVAAEDAESVPFDGAHESDNDEIMSTPAGEVKPVKVAKAKKAKAKK